MFPFLLIGGRNIHHRTDAPPISACPGFRWNQDMQKLGRPNICMSWISKNGGHQLWLTWFAENCQFGSIVIWICKTESFRNSDCSFHLQLRNGFGIFAHSWAWVCIICWRTTSAQVMIMIGFCRSLHLNQFKKGGWYTVYAIPFLRRHPGDFSEGLMKRRASQSAQEHKLSWRNVVWSM